LCFLGNYYEIVFQQKETSISRVLLTWMLRYIMCGVRGWTKLSFIVFFWTYGWHSIRGKRSWYGWESTSLHLKIFLFTWNVGWEKREGRKRGMVIELFGMQLFGVFDEWGTIRCLITMIGSWTNWSRKLKYCLGFGVYIGSKPRLAFIMNGARTLGLFAEVGAQRSVMVMVYWGFGYNRVFFSRFTRCL